MNDFKINGGVLVRGTPKAPVRVSPLYALSDLRVEGSTPVCAVVRRKNKVEDDVCLQGKS